MRPIALAIVVGSGVLAAVVLFLITLHNTGAYYPSTLSSDNSTLGITFTLALNSSKIHQGNAVNITAYETNDRSSSNNLTVPFNLSPEILELQNQASINHCPSFTNALVFRGYYSPANFSLAYPQYLQLVMPPSSYPHGCPGIDSFYPFGPRESRGGYTFSAAGYYSNHNLPANFKDFDPGIYTVFGADVWGRILVLHFEVLP